jgi:hypothetical protein
MAYHLGMSRRSRLLVGVAAAALVLQFLGARSARAQAPATLDPAGVSVAAYGGWAAWSHREASTGRYALVTRSPRGVISASPIPDSGSPFDVELGPARGAGVAAVYSRCADAARRRGCHIFSLELGAGAASERLLSPPGGGSVHEPAAWKAEVVFLRRSSSGGTRRPDGLFAWKIGSRSVQALALPSSRGNRNASWPAGLTGLIKGLTFNGRQVGYSTSNEVASSGETTLWFQPLGGRPELIDQETGSAGNVCPPEFVSPQLSGSWLYAYLHACDPSANPRLDRLTRYRHGEVQRATYTFLHAGDESIGSAVLDGSGVDWNAEAGIERLAHVSWRRITAPVPQTFCGRSDPFC